jgi:hypothetical protein
VTVTPEVVGMEDGVPTLRIPAAAGYGGELFRMTTPPM